MNTLANSPRAWTAAFKPALAGIAAMAATAALACPSDTTPRAAGTLLVVKTAAGERAYSATDLAALPAASLKQTQTVAAGGGTAASERSVTWGGTLLRDALAKSGFGGPQDRGARNAWVELVATDGYRAIFSWGELFNSSAGDQVIVITHVDGKPLDDAAGPVALRALGDLRPGPRHVRNLCAVLVRSL